MVTYESTLKALSNCWEWFWKPVRREWNTFSKPGAVLLAISQLTVWGLIILVTFGGTTLLIGVLKKAGLLMEVAFTFCFIAFMISFTILTLNRRAIKLKEMIQENEIRKMELDQANQHDVRRDMQEVEKIKLRQKEIDKEIKLHGVK